MTFYYGAHSERGLDEVCNTLRAALAMPAFTVWAEPSRAYTEPGPWAWASSSSSTLSLRITRMEQPLPADTWMPGQPDGANFLVGLYAAAEPPDFRAQLVSALGGKTVRYWETAGVWTVRGEVEQHYRWVRQSSCLDGLAIFTLRLSPTLDAFPCRFVDAVDYNQVERDGSVESEYVRKYVRAVEEGVDSCVQQWTLSGRPVGHLQVVLTEIVIHPVDSRIRHFRDGGARAMEQAFEQHAFEL